MGAPYMLAWVPSPFELGIIAVIALIFFGRRLPEVARSLGKSIVEFKKGIKGVEDEINHRVDHKEHRALPDSDAESPSHTKQVKN